MDKKSYVRTINKVSVSENKKCEISQILEEKVLQKQNAVKKLSNKKTFYFKTVLATFVLFIGVFGVMSYVNNSNTNGSDKIKTSLKKGELAETVYLTNGVLYFPSYKNNLFSESKIALPESKSVVWSYSQVCEYIGKDIKLKYVPKNLKDSNLNDVQTVYIDTNGNVVYDNINLTYSEEISNSEAPYLTVIMSKGKLPTTDEVFLDDNDTLSNIGNINVKIKCISNDFYSAELEYDGIGYLIKSSEITQKDFINVLLSIVE